MSKSKTPFTIKIVWFLVLVFLLVTIISQLVIHFYNPLRTETAELYSSYSYLQLTGVYVRDERIVSYNGSGVVSFVHGSGEKLAKNSVIAEIYANQSDLAVQTRIDELNRQIQVLRDAERLIGSDSSQLEAFSNQINEQHGQMLQYIANGDYSKASDMKNEYLNLLCKRQIVKGDEIDYSGKIARLEAQIDSLSAQISAQPHDLVLSETGYFVNFADGYESSLTYDGAENLTEQQIAEIIRNPEGAPPSGAIGKVISDYKWRLVCVADTKKTGDIYDGAQVTLRMGPSAEELTVTVDKVKADPDTGNSVIIFSCDRMNGDLVNGRTVQFRLMFDSYSGIRIPSEAIRFNDEGEDGVFVKFGAEIEFKRINVIVNEGDYAVVEDTTDKSGWLSLYDTVVVGGEDLHDGKIIMQ